MFLFDLYHLFFFMNGWKSVFKAWNKFGAVGDQLEAKLAVLELAVILSCSAADSSYIDIAPSYIDIALWCWILISSYIDIAYLYIDIACRLRVSPTGLYQDHIDITKTYIDMASPVLKA